MQQTFLEIPDYSIPCLKENSHKLASVCGDVKILNIFSDAIGYSVGVLPVWACLAKVKIYS